MSIFVALLRGINVSGHNKIKMAELKTSLATLGYANIMTYLQSGNVIFESSNSNINNLEDQIKSVLKRDFGHDISVLILTKDAFKKVYQNNLWVKDSRIDIKKLCTVFLNKAPDKEIFKTIQKNSNIDEKMILSDKVIYLYYTNGFGKAKVSNNFLEKKLGLTATTRNWNTVGNIHELLGSMQ